MSALPSNEPVVAAGPCSAVKTVILPRRRDLGGFEVGRFLPSIEQRTVGPFVFFDQMGPAVLKAGGGIDVRPHPHIGLATITYLFQGQILHRDSLGSVQVIQPGDVNWMTAGSGIVHSERTPHEVRAAGAPIFGIQSWIGLPRQYEETKPSFAHYSSAELPVFEEKGLRVHLLIGRLFGKLSPAATFSDTLYADAVLSSGGFLAFPADHEERAIHVVDGQIEIAAQSFGAGQMLILPMNQEVTATSRDGARLLLFGGEPLDGPRHIWWNFVSSSRDRIEQAKDDWKMGRFMSVPGETEFIPLPE